MSASLEPLRGKRIESLTKNCKRNKISGTAFAWDREKGNVNKFFTICQAKRSMGQLP